MLPAVSAVLGTNPALSHRTASHSSFSHGCPIILMLTFNIQHRQEATISLKNADCSESTEVSRLPCCTGFRLDTLSVLYIFDN